MTTILALLLFVFLIAGDTKSRAYSTAAKERGDRGMTIVIDKLEVSGEALLLNFQISNKSKHDVWYCDSINVLDTRSMEVFLSEDGETLVLRRRLGVPSERELYAPPAGSYVRLPVGEAHHQSISLKLPVQAHGLFTEARLSRGLQYPTRLALEIGFYVGDLPAMVRSILVEAERLRSSTANLSDCDRSVLEQYFGGFLVEGRIGGLKGFDEWNRGSDLSKKVRIPYTDGAIKGEACSRLFVDGVFVAYDDAE